MIYNSYLITSFVFQYFCCILHLNGNSSEPKTFFCNQQIFDNPYVLENIVNYSLRKVVFTASYTISLHAVNWLHDKKLKESTSIVATQIK